MPTCFDHIMVFIRAGMKCIDRITHYIDNSWAKLGTQVSEIGNEPNHVNP